MSQHLPSPSEFPASSRSSFTFFEPPSPPAHDLEKVPSGSMRIDAIVSPAEESLEHYGGDDIHEPPPKTKEAFSGGISAGPTLDANMVTWDGPDDPENPQNWSIRRKWFITILTIVMTVNVTFASSAPSSASEKLAIEFNVPAEVGYLVTTTFLLGYVFGPLFWGPGSELVGRRPILAVTMIVYTLFILGQALAQNMQTLLVTRFFSGFFAVAPVNNAGGLIADIWPAIGRGPATSLFTAAVFIGPVTGPIIAGYIVDSSVSWRWVFWVMFFFAGACTLIMLPTLPETYAPVILAKKVKRLRKEDPVGSKNLYAEHEKQDWSFMGVLNRTLFRPFKMLAQEPILLLITIYMSVVYGLLYGLFEAFPVIFMGRHGFTVAQTGLIFIGVGIGTSLGSLINYFASAHYPELIQKWKGFPPPEDRLYGAMLGSPVLVIGIFWLGWTGEYTSVPWYVPAISTILIGAGISLIFMSFLSYLVDTYLMYSASAFAANTICRSVLGASFPLFTVQMFTNLKVNWASTLIGLVALLFVPCPFLFKKYGPRIRAKSKFAPCIDLKIAEELKREAEQGGISPA